MEVTGPAFGVREFFRTAAELVCLGGGGSDVAVHALARVEPLVLAAVACERGEALALHGGGVDPSPGFPFAAQWIGETVRHRVVKRERVECGRARGDAAEIRNATCERAGNSEAAG